MISKRPRYAAPAAALFLAPVLLTLASTGAAGAAAIGLDEDVCGPLPKPRVLVLPGIDELPKRLVLDGGEIEEGLRRVVWVTPEPEGGVVAGDRTTEEFLRQFAMVTLWSHAEPAVLPAVRTPRWARPFGFPTEQTRQVDGLGEVAVTIHFDVHPEVPSDHIEPWIEARYSLGGQAYQMLTRGLGVDATLELAARTRPDGTRFERRRRLELDERGEGIVSAVMELSVGEAVAVLAEEGFCVLEVRGVDGATAAAGDREPVRGVELAGPRHLVLVVD